jgi:hypothetical protein
MPHTPGWHLRCWSLSAALLLQLGRPAAPSGGVFGASSRQVAGLLVFLIGWIQGRLLGPLDHGRGGHRAYVWRAIHGLLRCHSSFLGLVGGRPGSDCLYILVDHPRHALVSGGQWVGQAWHMCLAHTPLGPILPTLPLSFSLILACPAPGPSAHPTQPIF